MQQRASAKLRGLVLFLCVLTCLIELAFVPYFTYVWAKQPYMQDEFKLSITRAWNIAKREHCSLWNFIYGASGIPSDGGSDDDDDDAFDIAGAVQTLQEWPVSWINWPVDNSLRGDIVYSHALSRQGNPQSITLLPYDEITLLRWNGSPFDVKQGSGTSETDPTAWLLPYWMGRYYGYITESD